MAKNPLVSKPQSTSKGFSTVTSTNLVNQDDFPINRAVTTQEILANKINLNPGIGKDGYLVHCSPLMMNFVQPHEGTNPVIPTGTWDTGIREPSNIFIESYEGVDKFKSLYSGYGGTSGIGYAYSADGKTWVKYGSAPVITGNYQDPYIVLKDGTYYVYVEDNATNDIRLFTSTNFINWTNQGIVLPVGSGWENSLVGSPVVFIEDGIWKMIYEGIGVGTGGSFGYATSTDGITWTKYASNPVMADSEIPWISDSIVPDNIIKIDGIYYCLYHGVVKYPQGTTTARASIAFSSDLLSWKEYKDEWIDFGGQDGSCSDPHWFFDGKKWVIMYINGDSSGIKRGYPASRNFFHLTNNDTLDLEKQLKIRQNSSHFHMEEVDTGKEWHQEVAGSVFKIVETAVDERLTIDNTTGLVGVPSLTASKPVFTDANKKLSSSGTVPIANGGTNSTSFTSNTVPYYNGTSLVSDADLNFDGEKLSSKKLRYGNSTDYCDFSVEDYAGSGTPIPTITPYWGTSSGLPIALQRGGLFLQSYGGLMSQLFFLSADASLGITMSLDETNSRLNVDYPIQTQGYVASDNSVGISTTITSASLVGKTITIKDGLITGFA